MNKLKKSQILMLSLLAALLVITPLLSSSVRTTYLYFVINLLIIALGAEAGLLSAFSKPTEDKKYSASVAAKPVQIEAQQEAFTNQAKVITSINSEKKATTIEKSSSEKIPINPVKVDKVKKCSSRPSLFFIGSGENEAAEEKVFVEELYEEEEEEKIEEELVDGLNGQELFTKAEMFIRNFYKQLELQREESWKRIHGFYQRAF